MSPQKDHLLILEKQRRYRRVHPDIVRRSRRRQKWRHVGGDPDRIEDLIGKVLCGVCGKRPGIEVDHDHISRQARGLLCPYCNKMLAFAQDDPENLRQGAKYLEESGDGLVFIIGWDSADAILEEDGFGQGHFLFANDKIVSAPKAVKA